MNRREKAQREYEADKGDWQKLRRRRGELMRRREELIAEREFTAREAKATEVIPGSMGGAAVAAAMERVTEIDEELADLDRAEPEAKTRLEATEDELRRAVLAEVPGAMEDVAAATEPLRRALADLGEATLDGYAKVLPAVERRREALAVVAALERDLQGDPRIVSAQRSNVKRWLRALLEDATQEQISGLLVFQLLTWLRRGSTPIEAAWRERDIPLLSGSVLMDPFALGDAIHALREGRLPL